MPNTRRHIGNCDGGHSEYRLRGRYSTTLYSIRSTGQKSIGHFGVIVRVSYN